MGPSEAEAPQLSARAAVTGAAIGAVMCLSNLYVGLKTGLAVGVSLTACVASFALHRALQRLGAYRRRGPLSLLESAAMQSVASAAGYSTGGTIVTANAAYLLVTGHHLAPLTLLAWTLVLSALGVFFAAPVRRQMIEVEQLPFPTGTAAAQTLRSLHGAADGGEGRGQARALFGAAAAGGLLALLRDGLGALGSRFALPATLPLPFSVRGHPAAELSLSLECGAVGLGAGVLLGPRTAASLLLGALGCYALAAPLLFERGLLPGLGFEAVASWALWPGAGLFLSAALVHLAADGRAVLRAFRGLLRRGPAEGPEEIPPGWIGGGVLGLGLLAVALSRGAFGIPLPQAALAVALSFALSLIAARVTGETDVTPTGALGQLTQLTYGVLLPGDVVANLMTASVTGNTAGAAADLLTDLKTGHLLGASPRRQFQAQLLGCVVGSLVIVPGFYLLVPDRAALGNDHFPAPAATVLAGVADLLAKGLHALPPASAWGLGAGLLLGAVLALLERALPERLAGYVPSPTGLGLACVIPGSTSLMMALGGLLAFLAARLKRDASERYAVPLASGLIAGEGLLGAAITVLGALLG